MNDCTRKFLDYLTKFKRVSNYEYAEALQEYDAIYLGSSTKWSRRPRESPRI